MTITITTNDDGTVTITQTIADEFTVDMMSGASLTGHYSAIHSDIAATMFQEGVAELIRDGASEALALAFDRARPKHGLEGADLVKARRAWKAEDESAIDAIADAGSDLMAETYEKAQKGERRKRRGNGGVSAKFTALELAVYDEAVKASDVPVYAAIALALTKAKGKTTDERRALVLAAVDSLPGALSDALRDIAESTIAQRAKLAALTVADTGDDVDA